LQKSIPRAEHDVINICTGRPTSINFLLEKVFEIAGRTPRCDYGPGRTGDIRISVGDPSRLKARLGLHLQTTLPEGLSSLL
jgi:UDP-glucose 4-epimerase